MGAKHTGNVQPSIDAEEHEHTLSPATKNVLIYGFDGSSKQILKTNSNGELVISDLAEYKIADKDDDASPNYYGFTDKDGNWYILKETISAGADTYRYIKGTSDYMTNWTGRAGLSYDYYYNIF